MSTVSKKVHRRHYFFFSSSGFGSGFGVGSLNCSIVSNCAAGRIPSNVANTHRLRLAIMALPDLFPRCCTTFEVPECLCELQRLDHYSLLLLIISDLCVSSKREVLPQWVSIKPIIRHDPSQIWMVHKEHAEQVVYFSLIPVRAIVQAAYRWNRCGFICVGLDPNSGVVADGQEVVYDLEALVSGRVIDCGDIGDACEFSGCVVFEEGERGNDAGGRDVNGEFVFPDGEPALL